jgi:hypothetical protein
MIKNMIERRVNGGTLIVMIKRKCCWDTLIVDHDKAFQWKLTDKNRFEKKGRKRRGKTRDSRWQSQAN